VGIISWIVVGLIAGLLARFLLPGDDPGGLIVTTLIGMAGAVVGGILIGVLGSTGATGFNVWSIPGGYPGGGHTSVRLPAAHRRPREGLIPELA
jgi:uncharacterized membrane protein YeaQ/YmgE (transglycosylase-associated protein family)